MMRQNPIATAVLTLLDAQLTPPVGDHTAPDPAPAIYHVLEGMAGVHDGPMAAPGVELDVTLTIRTVAINSSTGVARQAAIDNADRAGAVLLGRQHAIAGTGWEITGRELVSDSGPIVEGPAVNVVRQYRLRAART